jgi:adenylate kinase
MYLVLIGPQGSGKGTQADRLVPKHSLMKIATGDLFRSEIAAGTTLGSQVKQVLDKGELVPDDVTLSIVEERLAQIDSGAARGAVFDGFPRTYGQAEGLDIALMRRGASIDLVIELVIPEAALIRRLAGRRVCANCGRAYHLEFHPPAVEGVCDVCGGRLEQRPDDTEEAIHRRLSLFREMTAPLLDYYGGRGLVRKVDGNRPVDEVEQAIDSEITAAIADPE